MTDKTKEALKLALAWVADTAKYMKYMPNTHDRKGMALYAILKEALAEQPAPPPECQTEAEKTAFAFGWFKALETAREQPAIKQDLTPEQPKVWVTPKLRPLAKLAHEQPAQQEPVAYIEHHKAGDNLVWDEPNKGTPLYTPPPAQRKPLTDDEIWKFWWARPDVPDGEDDSMEAEFVAAVRRILAAHGIKEQP